MRVNLRTQLALGIAVAVAIPMSATVNASAAPVRTSTSVATERGVRPPTTSGRYLWAPGAPAPQARDKVPDDTIDILAAGSGMWLLAADGTARFRDYRGIRAPLPIDSIAQLSGSGAGGDDSALVVLRRDGTVWVQGGGKRGQLGDGRTGPGVYADAFQQVQGLPRVVKISNAGGTVYALDADGTLWGWGSAYAGALGGAVDDFGATPMTGTPSRIPTNGPVADFNALGGGPVFLIGRDGVVRVFGCAKVSRGADAGTQVSTAGDVGEGRIIQRVEDAVPALQGATKIDGGGVSFYAGFPDGSVRAWGENWHGSLGIGAAEEWVPTPTPMPGIRDLSAVSTGIVLTRAGSTYSWSGERSVPKLQTSPVKALAVAGGMLLADYTAKASATEPCRPRFKRRPTARRVGGRIDVRVSVRSCAGTNARVQVRAGNRRISGKPRASFRLRAASRTVRVSLIVGKKTVKSYTLRVRSR